MRRFIFALFLTIQAVFFAQAQLSTALNSDLTWTTSATFGSPDWNTTSSQSLDGLAAVSRALSSPSFRTATLQTTVTGPGTLTFWSMIPIFSTANVYFVAGGSTQAVLFASGAWEQTTIYIASGTHTLKWIYATSSGSEPACYVDMVTYAAGSTAPFITSQPPSRSQISGLPARFRVSAQGTPPLKYQWQFNGLEIPDATNEFYTASQTQTTNLGAYRVVISNSVNSVTSSIATLEFGHTTAWGSYAFNRTVVPPGATNLLAIAANGGFNIAINSDHTLKGWGDNRHGQLTFPSDATNIIGIAAGWGHALALRNDGTVVAWGLNDRGQTNIPDDLTNVVSLAAGNSHSVALKSDGTVVAWGYSGQGQTNVPSGLTNVVAISTAGDHILALKSDGQVVAWGDNFSGQTTIPSELSNVVRIAAGTFHSIALKSDGTIVAWGSSAPNVTNVPAGLSNVVAIATGTLHALALKADGTIVAWGRNYYGETNVPTGLAGSVTVASGSYHALAVKSGEALVLETVLTNASFSNATFRIEVPSQCNRLFELQFKDDLATPDWTSLPLLPGNGGNLLFSDATAPAAGRFYRIRRW